ncbi:MAG: hypothetical protein UHS51_08445 [Atopobiaceae bacterium]|jgi:hypothetical protein|nr:hypothetical protein [Atopobiaceae bacterium]
MKAFERLALGMGLVVVGITMMYRYVLSDEQRTAMHEAGASLRGAIEEVSDTISNGPTKAEEREAAERNRASTAEQWEALGY